MIWINYDDVINQMRAIGLVIKDALRTDRMTRVDVEGEREKSRGWYHLHSVNIHDQPYLVGTYGIWSGNDPGTIKIDLTKECKACGHEMPMKEKTCPKCQSKQFTRREMDPETAAALKERIAQDKKRAEAERAAEVNAAAEKAAARWGKCQPVGESAYLKRKQVGAHGVRFEDGQVVVPMCDNTGRVFGLQLIAPQKKDGRDKDFWPAGMEMRGKYHLLGYPKDGVILLAEGYATAATLHEATGYCVAVGYNANNLAPVAAALKKRFRTNKILACGDDDYLTEGNPGQKSAQDAALAVGGAWVIPEFPADRSGEKLTDFNDLALFAAGGSLGMVAAQVEKALQAAGWLQSAMPLAGSSPEQGGGEAQLKPLLDVTEAVERYSLIYGAGGTMFDHQEHDLIPKSDVLDICVDHAWREWKLHPARSVVRLSEVGFDPAERDKTLRCNMWAGWPTVPKKGQCGALLDLLGYLCSAEDSRDSTVFDWVLKWLAYPLQHPGAKMKTALVFHGPQGTGKNLFFEAYAAIYGRYGRIVDQAAIDDKFNDWASKKLFMIADEVVARQELFHIKNKLKALITGDVIRINPKNVAAHEERNHVNLVFLSNERQPLVLEKDDRRYAVIYTPEKLASETYAEIGREIAEGGVAALHDYLKKLDLGDFNEHSKPPMTRSKQDLIAINQDSVERFIEDWQRGDLGIPMCPCASEDLYKTYLHWCRQNGVARPRESNQFLGYVVKIPRWERQRPMIYADEICTGKPKQVSVIRPPDEMIEEKYQKGAEGVAAWMTKCVIGFREAKRNHE